MQKKVYFKNLTSLRFIAALIVLLSHVGQLADLQGVNENFSTAFSPLIEGEIGVLLFFALSGFLITYLLLTEQQVTNTIRIKNFYIRRVLRIWPLYFLTIILALFIYPFVDFLHFKNYDTSAIWHELPLKLLFYCFFMPGIVMDFLGFIPYAAHTWTIGAEEQFYFIWPLLLKKIKNKKAIIAGTVLLYLLVYYGLFYFPVPTRLTKAVFLVWTRYPISCMAIGGAYAYLIFSGSVRSVAIKKILFSVWAQIALYAVIILLCIFKVHFQHLHNEIYALLLGYLVCNLAANPAPLFNIENKLFNYFGKISFGLYMFHPVAIAAAVKFCISCNSSSHLLLYTMAFLITLFLSVISYHLMEAFFIRKKRHYAAVISGSAAEK